MAARFTRRRVLVGLALLGLAGGAVTVARRSSYELPAGVLPAELAAWEWLVVRALARRVCAPDDPSVVTPDEADVVGFVDAYAAEMPRRMRRDLGRFLGVIEQLAPLGVGSTSRFSTLDPDAQDRVLAKLEASDSELLRGGFDGVKSLLFMGYYRDPRTWTVIGYDGPWVGARR